MEKHNNTMKYFIYGAVLGILLIALDQLTKYWAVTRLKTGGAIVLMEKVFELQYLENRGVAFGMFQNQLGWIIVSGVLILAVIGYFFVRLPKERYYFPLHIICVAVTAGALGNMIDRVTRGFVVDFFYFSLIDFAIFNVADIYITVSAVMLFILVIFYYKDEDFAFLSFRKKKKPGEENG